MYTCSGLILDCSRKQIGLPCAVAARHTNTKVGGTGAPRSVTAVARAPTRILTLTVAHGHVSHVRLEGSLLAMNLSVPHAGFWVAFLGRNQRIPVRSSACFAATSMLFLRGAACQRRSLSQVCDP